MKLHISDKDLRGTIGDDAACRRKYGAEMAKKLILRVAALQAAVSLADFWPPKSGPERCHELNGGRPGVFSVDLKHPYRLLFEPIGIETLPDRSDELKRWTTITAIDLRAIRDTHE